MRANISDLPFVDNGQIAFPSNNYYICFEQPKSNPVKQAQSNMQSTMKKGVKFGIKEEPEFKPAWVMEKKINRL